MKQHLYGVVNTIASDVVSVAKLQAEDVQRLSIRKHLHSSEGTTPELRAFYSSSRAFFLRTVTPMSSAFANLSWNDPLKPIRPVQILRTRPQNNLPYGFTLNSLSRVLRAVIRRLNGGTIDRHKNFVQALIMAVSERIGSEIDGPVDKNFAALQSAPSKSMDTAALSRITRMLFRFIQFILEGGDDSHWVAGLRGLRSHRQSTISCHR